MTQLTREGTPQELATFLAKRKRWRFRLIELPDKSEDLITHGGGHPDPENADSIALLQSWLDEDATDDPEQLRAAEEELREFKRNMNKPRREAGARLLYPEAE